MIACAISGLVLIVITIAAFEHRKGRWPLALAVFCLGGGVVGAAVAGIMVYLLANWPDGVKTSQQVRHEVTRTVVGVLAPSLLIGSLALWKWMKGLSNRRVEGR